MVSPLHGTVARIERGVGHRVDPGNAVATVEFEQTHVAVEAGVAGVVEEVRAVVGAAVEPGDVLVVVAAAADGQADQIVDDLIVDVELDEPTSPTIVCSHCGADEMEPGFIEDRGHGSRGYGRWVEGLLQRGLFGALRMGRRRRAIEAYRCLRCSHLELFATEVV